MKIVLIHGAPASGKLTVAKVLAENHGFKLLHNHLAVDLSLSIYNEWGDGDFHEFTDILRRIVIKKAKELAVEFLVMTWVVSSDTDQEEIKRYLDFFVEEDITVFPVFLNTSKSELLKRAVQQNRKNTNKISCDKQLQLYLEKYSFSAIEHMNTLAIDNTSLSPEDVVTLIVKHLNETHHK